MRKHQIKTTRNSDTKKTQKYERKCIRKCDKKNTTQNEPRNRKKQMKFTKSLATKKCDKKNVVRKSTKYVTEINAKNATKKSET